MGTSFEKGTQGEVAKKVSNIRKSEMNSGKSAATPEERFKSLRKLANNNNAEAQYHLSQCYLNGEGTEEDQIAYLFWLKESAESGYAEAQFELSQLYYKGVGVNESEEKGMYWLRKAAEGNSPRAQYVIGGMNINDDGEVQDADAFFYWMDKAAKNGFADAQYCLSLCYELGIGVEEDEQQHTYWLHKAAESGSVNAQNELNELGEESEKTEDDDDIDLDEFLNHAQEELGQMIGDLQASQLKLAKAAATPEERFEILHELAKDDCVEAQYELSQCYLNGDGTEEDETACLYWLKKAAEGNWPEAQLVLSGYYLGKDEPTEEDMTNGVKWVQKAANSGLAEAQYGLSLCYESGMGVEEDETLRIYWLRKAAEGGYADAQEELIELGKKIANDEDDIEFEEYVEQPRPKTEQLVSNVQSLQTKSVDIVDGNSGKNSKSGGFWNTVLSVAKATAEIVTEVINSVPLHDKKAGLFMLNKSLLSDSFKALTPSEMSGKQWQNISAKLGNSVAFDTVIGFIDTTLFSSGKNGYLFTDDAVYFQDLFGDPEVIQYDEIKSMKVIGKNSDKDSNRSLVFTLKDGSQIVWDRIYVNKTAVRNLIDALITIENPEQS